MHPFPSDPICAGSASEISGTLAVLFIALPSQFSHLPRTYLLSSYYVAGTALDV